MRFLHIADCHLGGWRNEKLNELSLKAFKKSLDIGLERKVNAILITGDLFDVPLPSLKIAIEAIKKLKEVRDKGIKIYSIAGSHDVSVNNVGIINLLESAKILKNVDFRRSEDINYFVDDGLFIVGIEGKRNSKEIEEISELKNFIEKNNEKIKSMELEGKIKNKVLLVHSTVREVHNLSTMPQEISINDLPEGFDYYALGHIHTNNFIKTNGSIYAYPGPTFPNNFEEIERLKCGSCFIFDSEKKEIEKIDIVVCDVSCFNFSGENKTPFILTQEIIDSIENRDLEGKIITLRLEGKLKEGRPSQIDFERINKVLEKKKVLAVLKNTSKLDSSDFDVDIEIDSDIEKIEVIEDEILEKIGVKELVRELINLLDKEKKDGETNFIFEERVLSDLKDKEEKLLEMFENENKKNFA